jgi:phage terminase large subunit
MLFLDSAGIAGAIGTRLRELGHRNVLEVNFGSDSPNPKRRYMRDHMWSELKDWLLTGAIDTAPRLESDLLGPGLRPDRQQRIWLESKEDMKKRGIDSPDDADALALTFAQTVKAIKPAIKRGILPPVHSVEMSWGV